MGKSACADLLRARGLPVIDTDQLARQLVQPGEPALDEIRHVFGPESIDLSGHLRRDWLAERVFADPGARRLLEAILHPRIRRLWRDQILVWRQEGKALAVVVIPLLFETQAQEEFHFTLCIACSATTQRHRIQPRGWTASQLEQREAAQWPIERKIAAAHFLVWTEGELSLADEQLSRIIVSVDPELQRA